MAFAPALTIRDLNITKHDRDRVFEVRVPKFEIRRGQAVALFAPSGAGKSTLLDTLALIQQPTQVADFRLADRAGDVLDLNQALSSAPLNRLNQVRARNIGYVLQTGGLLPYLTAEENIMISARIAKISHHAGNRRCQQLAKSLGIMAHLKKKPAKLSVGERQRVALARALCHQPSVILADEPTAALDARTAEALMRLLLEHARSTDAGVVISSHDRDLLETFNLPIASCIQAGHTAGHPTTTFAFDG